MSYILYVAKDIQCTRHNIMVYIMSFAGFMEAINVTAIAGDKGKNPYTCQVCGYVKFHDFARSRFTHEFHDLR